MRAYSEDLRQRVGQAVANGNPPAEVAETYQIALATVYRYVARQRELGTLKTKPKSGRPRKITRTDEVALRAQVEQNPDAILAEHCEQWAESSKEVLSVATMHRAIARLGMTRKKRRSIRASEMQEREANGVRKSSPYPPNRSSSSMKRAPRST